MAPAGFSLEANKVFATLALAQEFIQTKPAAYVGSVISVTNDTAENNGIYWVESIGEGASLRPANDIDLSNYYTKEEVEALIPEVPSIYLNGVEQEVVDGKIELEFEIPAPEDVDLSGYYTKEEVNNTFATKEEIPSLDEYLKSSDAESTYVKQEGYIAYTQEEKDKLANISEGAEVNFVKSVGENLNVTDGVLTVTIPEVPVKGVTVDGTSVVGKDGIATIDLTSYAKTSDVDSKIVTALTSVYKYKGSVATYEDLPSTKTIGDVYNVESTGDNYAWDGTTWDKLGTTVDLSGYALKTDLKDWVETTTFNSHVNNKTDALHVTAEEKETWSGKQDAITDENKIPATLIDGLTAIATSGSYDDLADKPDIPTTVAELTDSEDYAKATDVETISGKVDTLTTTVGDSTNGLVKDVATNTAAIEALEKLVVGGEGEGLEQVVTDVATLKTVVGDENSGLVKDVKDLKDNKQDKLADGTDGQILIWSSNAWTPSDMPETLPVDGKGSGKILTVDTDGSTVIWASAPVSTTVTKNEVAEGETQTWEIKQGETSVNVYSVDDTYNKTEVYTKAEVDSFFTWQTV